MVSFMTKQEGEIGLAHPRAGLKMVLCDLGKKQDALGGVKA